MTSHERMEILPTNHKKPEWPFYPTWIVLTFLCVPVAFFLDLVVLRIIIKLVGEFIYVNGVRHITEDYLGMYIFVPVVGFLTGVLQYELLRRHLPRMGWWVPATIGGWLLGVLVLLLSGWLHLMNTFPGMDVILIVMGLSIGVAQWLLLRLRLPRAGWWIAANGLGWGLLALITPGESLDQYGLFTLGFLPACATAAMLALLMKQVSPTQSQRM